MTDLGILGRLRPLSFYVWLGTVVSQQVQVHDFVKLVSRGMVGDVRFADPLVLGQVGQFPSCDVILKLVWEVVEVKVRDYERDR